MKRIHYKDIENKLKECKLIREDAGLGWLSEGNGGLLYTDNEYYYKIWDASWVKSDCIEKGFKEGLYTTDIVPLFDSLIYDDDGNRGYITRKGTVFSSISDLIDNTTREQRKEFLLSLLNNIQDSIYFDLTYENILSDNNKLSLIDLDSYLDLEYLFTVQTFIENDTNDNIGYYEWDGEECLSNQFFCFYDNTICYGAKRVEEKYECNAEANKVKAWEVTYKHFNTLYKDYLNKCLNINYNKEITSKQSLIEIRELIEKEKT